MRHSPKQRKTNEVNFGLSRTQSPNCCISHGVRGKKSFITSLCLLWHREGENGKLNYDSLWTWRWGRIREEKKRKKLRKHERSQKTVLGGLVTWPIQLAYFNILSCLYKFNYFISLLSISFFLLTNKMYPSNQIILAKPIH